MPYFEGKERFWEKEHHYLFGSHTVYQQTARQDSEIKAARVFPPEFQAHQDTLLRSS